jgi:hypothetical protein
MKGKIILVLGLLISVSWQAQVKVLFDATKAESAGNADWVIDADVHNPTIVLPESLPQDPVESSKNSNSCTKRNYGIYSRNLLAGSFKLLGN